MISIVAMITLLLKPSHFNAVPLQLSCIGSGLRSELTCLWTIFSCLRSCRLRGHAFFLARRSAVQNNLRARLQALRSAGSVEQEISEAGAELLVRFWHHMWYWMQAWYNRLSWQSLQSSPTPLEISRGEVQIRFCGVQKHRWAWEHVIYTCINVCDTLRLVIVNHQDPANHPLSGTMTHRDRTLC